MRTKRSTLLVAAEGTGGGLDLLLGAETTPGMRWTAVQAHCPDVRVVVRGPAPAGLDADVIAASLDLRLAGQLRPEPGLAAALERGEPPARRGSGPLSRLCGRLLDELLAGRDVGPAAA